MSAVSASLLFFTFLCRMLVTLSSSDVKPPFQITIPPKGVMRRHARRERDVPSAVGDVEDPAGNGQRALMRKQTLTFGTMAREDPNGTTEDPSGDDDLADDAAGATGLNADDTSGDETVTALTERKRATSGNLSSMCPGVTNYCQWAGCGQYLTGNCSVTLSCYFRNCAGYPGSLPSVYGNSCLLGINPWALYEDCCSTPTIACVKNWYCAYVPGPLNLGTPWECQPGNWERCIPDSVGQQSSLLQIDAVANSTEREQQTANNYAAVTSGGEPRQLLVGRAQIGDTANALDRALDNAFDETYQTKCVEQ